jgi:hypothetical protein
VAITKDDMVDDAIYHYDVKFPLPGIPGLREGEVLCWGSQVPTPPPSIPASLPAPAFISDLSSHIFRARGVRVRVRESWRTPPPLRCCLSDAAVLLACSRARG